MVDMQCMLQISPTRMLMGGHQEKLIDFNLTRGKETGLVRSFDIFINQVYTDSYKYFSFLGSCGRKWLCNIKAA